MSLRLNGWGLTSASIRQPHRSVNAPSRRSRGCGSSITSTTIKKWDGLAAVASSTLESPPSRVRIAKIHSLLITALWTTIGEEGMKKLTKILLSLLDYLTCAIFFFTIKNLSQITYIFSKKIKSNMSIKVFSW
jgi:hypothetical protein